jgi:transcription elongation factor Elf1
MLRAGQALVRPGGWKARSGGFEFRPHSTFAVQLPAVVGRCPYCNHNTYETELKKAEKGGPVLCALCGSSLSNREPGARSQSVESEHEEVHVAHHDKKDPFVSHVRSGGQVDDKETRHQLQEKRIYVHEISRNWQRTIFKMVSLVEQRRMESTFGVKPTPDVEEAMRWMTTYDDNMWNHVKALKNEQLTQISPSQRMLSSVMF